MAKRNNYFLLRVKGEFEVKTSCYCEDEDDHPFSVMWSGKSVEYETSTSVFKEAEFNVKEIYPDESGILSEWIERQKEIENFLTIEDKEVFLLTDESFIIHKTPARFFKEPSKDFGTFELDKEDYDILRKDERAKGTEWLYLIQTNGPIGRTRVQTVWIVNGEFDEFVKDLRFNWDQLRSSYNPREIYEIESSTPDGYYVHYDRCYRRQLDRDDEKMDLIKDLLVSAGICEPAEE